MTTGFVERFRRGVVFPSSAVFQAGGALYTGGAGAFAMSGNLLCQGSAAGINPGATGADNVLAAYMVPQTALDNAGRSLLIQAQGTFAANGHTKECKIIIGPASAVVGQTVGAGGTVIADTGASTGNNVGWLLQASLIKYGAKGSNTQIGQQFAAIVGATHGGVGLSQPLTQIESAFILIAITGNAATTATDIALNQLTVSAAN